MKQQNPGQMGVIIDQDSEVGGQVGGLVARGLFGWWPSVDPLLVSVDRDTPQHCSVLSSAFLTADFLYTVKGRTEFSEDAVIACSCHAPAVPNGNHCLTI
jgi:hypothetical protein